MDYPKCYSLNGLWRNVRDKIIRPRITVPRFALSPMSRAINSWYQPRRFSSSPMDSFNVGCCVHSYCTLRGLHLWICGHHSHLSTIYMRIGWFSRIVTFSVFLFRCCCWLHWPWRPPCEKWWTFCSRWRPVQNMLLCGWHSSAVHITAVLSATMPKVGTNIEPMLQVSLFGLGTVNWWQ